MRALNITMVVAFFAGTAVAFAAEKTINQKGKVFSETEISIKKGDSLSFVNDDTFFHNVFSISAGNKFNLGSIAPGNATSVTFQNAGMFRSSARSTHR